MKKTIKIALLLAMVLMLAFVLTGCPQQEEQPNEPPQEQADDGANEENGGDDAAPDTEGNQLVKDEAPEGCASCHKKISDEKDYRLSAETKNVEGHPPVSEDATVKTCIKCHGEDSDRPFEKVIHRIHLVESKYLEEYGLNCINCHQLADDGTITVKGLEEEDDGAVEDAAEEITDTEENGNNG